MKLLLTLFLFSSFFMTVSEEGLPHCLEVSGTSPSEYIEISGSIEMFCAYGSPGYGEDPLVDRVNSVYFITMDRPLCLKKIENNELIPFVFSSYLQLEAYTQHISSQELSMLVGKNVLITGNVFESIAGPHYFPFLVQPKSIVPEEITAVSHKFSLPDDIPYADCLADE